MTTFFFDIDGAADLADEGLDLPDVETALAAALQAFPDMVRDREPMSDQRRFQVTVRNAHGPLFQITLELLPGSSPTPDAADRNATLGPHADDLPLRPPATGTSYMNKHEDLIASVAKKHAIAPDAVAAAFAALKRGRGTMAQFSHADFGGMAQWSKGGMSMVGDMFNSALKAKFDGVMADLAEGLAREPIGTPTDEGALAPMSRKSRSSADWPEEFGAPSSSGSQNGMKYAFFPTVRRLIVEDGSERTVYDTGKHQISGVSQQQSGSQSLRFHSQVGDVDLDDLTVAGEPSHR